MGKWRYMSPEQARGEKLDARSDLFSAAAVMFELFTGRQAVSRATRPRTIIENVGSMEVPSVCALRPELPTELDAPLRAALSRDRAQRATVGQVLNTLVNVCYGRSIPALPVTLARFLEEVPRHGRDGADDDDVSMVSSSGASSSASCSTRL